MCEASQLRHDFGTDWGWDNSEVIIGGDCLIESITDAEQLEVTPAPGVIWLQQREVGVFRA
ncbi:hypothetical protein CEQ20_09145 [Yersinia pseudotuberculosis]|nr:hypothetical protein CEQ20_09145 [Yersinia pseudotuberculosis]AYX13259.1 hypothetical protein EGX52_22185 [Yersinia pseudotuberculosis]MBO1556696.1 hypothetical protein [Yersinia pseudotuberculosis]MBO1568426.1 hypothetical protein [Yersinia pseudotuberculosis]MBO1591902.1 hypothetical protein [Yersinia pseudotuberculosis]